MMRPCGPTSVAPRRLLAAARVWRLQRRDVGGLRPLVAGLGVIGDLRALGERLEAAGVDGAVVDEEVLATVVGRDEAEALVVVEPLHGSGRHEKSSTAYVHCERGGSCLAATTAGAEHGWRRTRRARHEHAPAYSNPSQSRA